MRIIAGIDQLRVYPHAIAHSLHAALHQVRDPELLRDFAQIARDSALVLHHGCAADHFQVGDLGEVSQNFVLHAIGEEGVLLCLRSDFRMAELRCFFQERAAGAAGRIHCGTGD